MNDEPLVLLNPGPACTTERVRAALGRGDMCHRESEFTALLADLREGLVRCLNVAETHETVLVTGSGTSAMEMAVISSVREGRSLLVVNNGVYGDRLAKIARANGIPVTEVSGDWTTPIDPELVREALAADPSIDAVAMVFHETTTGLINPVRAVGAVVRDSEACFVVDAISATANEDEDLADIDADFICGTANKGLHALPGMSFILVSQKAVRRLYEVPTRSLYLNAATYLDGQRKGDVPFTPAVQVCFALDEAIKEFEERGGFAARTAEYRARADLVRKAVNDLGLKILVEPPHRSNAVTMIRLPEGVTYPTLHDELKAAGYVIYAGQGTLSKEFFRIATMGEIPWPKLERFVDVLGSTVHQLRSQG
ncbi:pyridoxal-phosphate-dependent aminotransferase family protein [Streptomyces sp. NPDC020800]|uniref:pyridoxal-phosphate-dependent aminotransferase family protein n=1 Tax=Streptomyces sp. NPDC020800 TaxID=3365092 RepID=UPI00378CCD17